MGAPIPLTFGQFTSAIPSGLSAVLVQIGVAGKLLAQDLRRAALLDVLGTTGLTNVQGETVKKLDERANEVFVELLQHIPWVAALASEEMEEPVIYQPRGGEAEYLLLVDPLDGSTNTDSNMPLGAIFSVLAYNRTGQRPTVQDFLRRGVDQVAAGYLLFGSSTLLVYTTGQGVHGFTLDPGIGEYVLSHRNIRMPEQGRLYAVNEGNYHKWMPGMRRYIDHLKAVDKPSGRPYSGRYSGCLVADVHRMLLNGGLYLYPGEAGKPEGKLRLLYEANPLGWVVEQAGGRASTGTTRILDQEPKQLHQRVPLIIGSRLDVETAEAFAQGAR